jgi:hypothetical protein
MWQEYFAGEGEIAPTNSLLAEIEVLNLQSVMDTWQAG